MDAATLKPGDSVEIPFDGLDRYELLTVLRVDETTVEYLSTLDVRRTPRRVTREFWAQKTTYMTAFYPAAAQPDLTGARDQR